MESQVEIFALIKEYCRQEMPASPYSIWIKDITCESFDHTGAVLSVKTDLRKQIIEAKYLDLLSRAFEAVMGFEVALTIVSEESSRASPPPVEAFLPGDGEPRPGGSPGSEYDYTFSTFIVGASNKFAHAASLAVATNPASSYNPLFIYGGSGLGKTHLLCAICTEIKQSYPKYNIIYVKGEDFTNELINAIKTERTKNFHDKYRQADVLLVDDIQFISGKEMTQEEFFHTFNTLYEANKQIVLTSDRPPKEIKTLEDRLRTRFESGLIADVQPPDYETRVAILRRKAESLDIVLPDDVTEYIANRLKTNIRQLEGTVKKIKAYKLLANIPPSVVIAQNAIRDILSDSQPISVTVERIINEVSRYFEVSPQEIRSIDRTAPVSAARQASMYIIREVTQMSMASIGEEFSGKDHSTVVYAIKQTQKTMANNSHFKNTIEDIIKNIRDN
jgi:chromosomal replication initiator protein